MNVFIDCELCGARIASAILEDLSYPLRGGMFSSPDEWHDVPPPFDCSNIEWEWMRCRTCKHNPFPDEDRITCTTEEGITFVHPLTASAAAELNPEGVVVEAIESPAPQPAAYVCQRCGKTIPGRHQFKKHLERHKRTDAERDRRNA